MGPDGEDALFAFLQKKLQGWQDNLGHYKTLADTGNYPGRDEISDGLSLTKALLACDDAPKLIERFNEREKELLDFSDEYSDLEHFYEHQRPTWDKLRLRCDRFKLNSLELGRDEKAGPALKRMQEILSASSPYGIIKEAEGLITTVDGVNKQLVADRRAAAVKVIDGLKEQIEKDVHAAGGDDSLKTACLSGLNAICRQVDSQESLAHIAQAEREAQRAFDAAMKKIEEWAVGRGQGAGKSGQSQPTIKPRIVVAPAMLVQTTYLETQDDIDRFLGRLRHQLEEAIHNGHRIHIQ
jgi:hypothetical protein